MNENKEQYSNLRKQNFVILPNFLSEEEITWSYDYFDRYIAAFKVKGDAQVKKSSSMYNFMPFVQILCNKTEKVSRILGVNVLPTYCFARKYYTNAELRSHMDREACEISLSIHLDGDKDWELYIKGTPVTLNRGDAVLYWGYDDKHWREPYTGHSYTNLFLHYVRLMGPFSEHVFDAKILK